ncbi:MAG: 30S ribosomal protein S6 [Candidatus Kerfeldbacteria bacterium]|nr:30S ribosomal protein S6 [Candidatus Kerfeldbacteria bacterium]
MKHYELLAIVPGTLSDDEVQTAQQTVRTLLEKHSAQITKQEIWEKRKLAYPIRRIRQGNYFLFLFDIDAANIGALDRTLTLERGLLRHQIIIAHQKTAKELERESRRFASLAAARSEQATQESRQTARPEEQAPALTGKELDEKLEKILEDDIVK